MSKSRDLSSYGTAALADTGSGANNVIAADASGNVGIGTSSADELLSLDGGNIKLTNNASGESKIYFTHSPSADRRAYIGALETDGNGNSLIFASNANGTDGVERVRIDSSGNLLVGKASSNAATVGAELKSDGAVIFNRDNAYPTMYVYRASSDGEFISFRKSSTTAGSVGVDSGDNLYIGSTSTNHAGVAFGTNQLIPRTNGSNTDNAVDLGASGVRFNDIYLGNQPTVTSDQTQKQDILEITTAEAAVAKACKGLLRSFRWIDAVEKKGDDARIHFGIMAQDLQDAFTAEGLDAGRYGMFMSSTWWETQTEVAAVAAVAAVDEVTDEDGNVTTEAVEAKDAHTRTDTFETLAEAPAGATERTRLGVRYSELLAFIIAAL
jgi:hypothetical protein